MNLSKTRLGVEAMRRESIYTQIEDSNSKYDKQLEEIAAGNVLSRKMLKHCRMMRQSHLCSNLTKIFLWVGGVAQALCIITIAMMNLANYYAPPTQGVIVIITVGICVGIPLMIISTCTTGCFPDTSSDLANIRQDSYTTMKDFFDHLAWRMMRRFYEFNQAEAIELARKVYQNIYKVQDKLSEVIGVHDSHRIVHNLLDSARYIETENEEERKIIFREWPNEEIKSYITSQNMIHMLGQQYKELMLEVHSLKEKVVGSFSPKGSPKEDRLEKPTISILETPPVTPQEEVQKDLTEKLIK